MTVAVEVVHLMVTLLLVGYLEYLDENDHVMKVDPVEIDAANHKDLRLLIHIRIQFQILEKYLRFTGTSG